MQLQLPSKGEYLASYFLHLDTFELIGCSSSTIFRYKTTNDASYPKNDHNGKVAP